MSTSQNLQQRNGGTLPPQDQPKPTPPVTEHDPSTPLQKTAVTPPTPTTTPVTPNPATTPVIQQGDKIYVRNDYQVASQTTTPTTTGTVTNYTFEPKPTPQSTMAQQASNPVLNRGILGSNPEVTSGLETAGIKPLLNTPEKRMVTLEVVSLPISYAVAPTAALIGAGVGVVASPAISEGANLIQGKGFISNNQFINSVLIGASGGAAFSVVGAGVTGALGLSEATGVGAAVGRVGVNTALGAGGGALYEYTSTGKITTMGVAEGAGFGLAFGVAGETVNAYVPKVQAKTQDYMTSPKHLGSQGVLSTLDNVDSDFEASFNTGQSFKPTFTQNIVMRMTGLYPIEPKIGIVELPTLTTEPTGTIDLTAKAVADYNKTIMASKVADPSSIIVGKSVEPTNPEVTEELNVKPNLPTYKFNGKELVEQNELSFTDGKEAFTRPNENMLRIGNFAKPKVLDYTGLMRNIKNYPDLPTGDQYQDAAIAGAQTSTPITKTNGEYWTNQDKAIAQQLVNKPLTTDKDVGIGINKTLDDLIKGNTPDTSLRQQTRTSMRANFNIPYPSTKRKTIVEEEISYNSFPAKSPLSKPGTITMTSLSQGLQQNLGTLQPNISLTKTNNLLENKETPDTANIINTEQSQENTPITAQTPTQLPITITTPTQITTPKDVTITIPNNQTSPFNPYLPNGLQYNKFGEDYFSIKRRTGLRSNKKTYPILSGKQFLATEIGFLKPKRKKKRIGDL